MSNQIVWTLPMALKVGDRFTWNGLAVTVLRRPQLDEPNFRVEILVMDCFDTSYITVEPNMALAVIKDTIKSF